MKELDTTFFKSLCDKDGKLKWEYRSVDWKLGVLNEKLDKILKLLENK